MLLVQDLEVVHGRIWSRLWHVKVVLDSVDGKIVSSLTPAERLVFERPILPQAGILFVDLEALSGGWVMSVVMCVVRGMESNMIKFSRETRVEAVYNYVQINVYQTYCWFSIGHQSSGIEQADTF